ncbi:MAG TPA: molecular chaperone [Gammaproteobacteria bacterium]
MKCISSNRSASHMLRQRQILFASCLLVLFSVTLTAARAGILVAPTRLVLEPGERVGEVTVMNNGADPVTLRISFVNYHMRANGSFDVATEPLPGEHFADDFLRYAPRRIHLAPGEGQTVRILARPPSGAPVEYRSHLRFQTEPPLDAPSKGAGNGGNERDLSIELIPLYGVSIPVIVRTGDLSATVAIDSLSVRSGPRKTPMATFRLRRSGNRSIYGDIRLYLTPQGGEERLVGETLGLAVYPPLEARNVSVPFNKLDAANLPPGRLRVEYVDHDDNARVLAEAERVIR